MARNISGYTPMIEIIRDGVFHLRKALADPYFTIDRKELLLQMFKLAHQALTNFCSGNELNQKILHLHLKLFLSNLDIDIGQIPLICEICRDNRYISEASGETIINSLIDAIVTHGRKSSFLDPIIVT